MHLVGGEEYVRQSMLITKGDDKIELIKLLVFDILGKFFENFFILADENRWPIN